MKKLLRVRFHVDVSFSSVIRKLFVLVPLCLIALSVTQARADTIALANGAIITPPTGPPILLAEGPYTFGSGADTATIAFNRLFPRQNFTVDYHAPAAVPLGEFVVSFTGNGATLPTGTRFSLLNSAFQLAPLQGSTGSLFINGTLSGAIGPGNSATLFFADPRVDIFLFDPAFQTQPDFYSLAVMPSTLQIGVGSTSLNGELTKPTPEPTTLLLFGTALAGVAFRVRRKLRSKR